MRSLLALAVLTAASTAALAENEVPPAAVSGAPVAGPVAGKADFLAEIESWRADRLPKMTPPLPLTTRFEPRLDEIKARVDAARAKDALIGPRRDFEAWKNELLRAQFQDDKAAGLARGTFESYAAGQKQAAALASALRAAIDRQRAVDSVLHEQARAVQAGSAPSAFFDGAARRGSASGPSVVAAPPAPDPKSPARYAKVRGLLISQGASPRIVDLAIQEAIKQGADPLLVLSVVRAESGFNPHARSRVGARGLMQIMPDTGRGLGVRDADRLYDVQTNLRAGIRFLKYLWNRFTGDMKSAVAAYNAGPGAVDKYDGVPPYRETQGYVKTVLGYYAKLQQYLGW